MQNHNAFALFLSFFLIFNTPQAHNITRILEKHPEFSTFNHYLTVTQLAPEINRRETITVCAVDNGAMDDLLAKHLTIGGIKNVLSLHVLLDYFDAKKLHDITDGTALAATMYQATGSASGSSGFVNIKNLKGGKVGFSPQDSDIVSATLVKSVEAISYNISVIHISNLLPSVEAEAPAPGPRVTNLTAIMSMHGCKVFAETLLSNPAEDTFESNVEGGLTILCPGDDAMKAFLPKYKNLTTGGKQSLLEYHGMPVYQSMQGLRTSNGLSNTLATDGASKFAITVQNDGTTVTIKTKRVTARIMNTIVDDQPLAIYMLNKVLEPSELLKGGLSPAPAPAPEEAAVPAPSRSRRHRSPPARVDAESPAYGPDGDAAEQTADGSNGVRFDGGGFGGVVLSLCLMVLANFC